MPDPVTTIRHALHVISVVGESGRTILRLAVPIIAVVSAVATELKKKK